MSEPPQAAWLVRPPAAHWAYFAGLAAAVGAWFVLIYGGCNWITASHAWRVRLHLDAELSIPFVPWTVLGYMALYPMYLLAPLALRTRRQLRALAGTIAGITLAAGVGFLLLPADNVYPPQDAGVWQPLVWGAKQAALTHNFFPSLHVGMATATACVLARNAPAWGRVLLALWTAAIAASTLLLHQHYLLDVAGGIALGVAGEWWLYRRWSGERVREAST